MAAAGDIVAVTGVSGFLAGHIARKLLNEGFVVRGTVRSLADAEKIAHLRADLPSVELFEADLLSEGSFDACFAGCKGVFHTASPFQVVVADPQRDLIDPALKGTLNVLRAALRAGVQRVVLTSSAAAIVSQKPPAGDKVWTEEDWNTDSTLADGPYRLSKSLAERAAWDFVENEGKGKMTLVTMNPSFILGAPMSRRTDSTSIAVPKKFLDGSFKDGVTNDCVGCVYIGDVAEAHVRAMKNSALTGRFLLSSTEGFSRLEMARALSTPEFEGFPIPSKESAPVAYRPIYNRSKAERELGITFTPVDEALREACRFLVKEGIVSKPVS